MFLPHFWVFLPSRRSISPLSGRVHIMYCAWRCSVPQLTKNFSNGFSTRRRTVFGFGLSLSFLIFITFFGVWWEVVPGLCFLRLSPTTAARESFFLIPSRYLVAFPLPFLRILFWSTPPLSSYLYSLLHRDRIVALVLFSPRD